jgi:uncharacterized protein (TIGR00369 family)
MCHLAKGSEEAVSGTPFHEFLGVRFITREATADGAHAVVEMEGRSDLMGPSGYLEGGIIATLVDIAGASSCARALDSWRVATEHISMSYLAPGKIGPFRATGKVLRFGQRDAVAQVEVTDEGATSRLMSVALLTVRKLEERKTEPHFRE